MNTAAAQAVIDTARRMGEVGVNNGTSGNVSARTDAGMLVTPSSVPYDELTVDDIIAVAADGSWAPLGTTPTSRGRLPSSEWRIHHDIYAARPDAQAIVHAHPVHATALSCHRRGITSFHYMVAVAGGSDIRCADYATFGTAELSANAVAALEDRTACLLANHGIVTIGNSLEQALAIAVEVEVLASQYLAALALGEPILLTEQEMAQVQAKMNAGAGYGSS